MRFIPLLLMLAIALPSRADEKLKGIACRSVHLQFPGPEAIAFYNEVTPLQSADGTYFCVCGFNKGYFGIQESATGKKQLIFSIWDPGSQNDPNAVKDDDRVKLMDKDPDTKVGRFGNEGTGGQSFYPYDWKVNETYKFLVKSKDVGEGRVEFAGWFYHPEAKEWKRVVSFSTRTKGQLKGLYSFVEDYRRNRISTTKPRVAFFGNTWAQTADGKWHELTKAQFTADSNPVLNVNAKVDGARFWLGTGGEMENSDVKLRAFATRPESKKRPDLSAGESR